MGHCCVEHGQTGGQRKGGLQRASHHHSSALARQKIWTLPEGGRKEGRKEEGRREGGKGERKKERKFVPVLLLDAKLLSPGCCAWRCWVRWKGMTF
jgi:hypothetical protein